MKKRAPSNITQEDLLVIIERSIRKLLADEDATHETRLRAMQMGIALRKAQRGEEDPDDDEGFDLLRKKLTE